MSNFVSEKKKEWRNMHTHRKAKRGWVLVYVFWVVVCTVLFPSFFALCLYRVDA